MLLGRKIDMQRVFTAMDNPSDEQLEFRESLVEDSDCDSISDLYVFYNVNNDFDLIEAVYKRDKRFTGSILFEPWFKKFRIKCAMNPEYTKRCLASEAFWDIKDDILRRIKND